MKSEINQTVQQRVYLWMREKIMSGEWAPGRQLLQDELAEDLQVSLTPVREALRDLAKEKLVEQTIRKQSRVAILNEEQITDLYRLRLLIEPEVTRLAVPRMDEASLQRAASLAEELADPHHPQWTKLNAEFHDCLIAAAPSRRLVELVRGLHAESRLFVSTIVGSPERHSLAVDEHWEILNAYLRRDADAAMRAIEKHLRSSLSLLAQARGVAYELSPTPHPNGSAVKD